MDDDTVKNCDNTIKLNVILELIFKQLLMSDKTDPLFLHRRLQLSSISES